jgi:hypothetical protein
VASSTGSTRSIRRSPSTSLAAVALSNRRGSPLSVRLLFAALSRAAAPHAGCVFRQRFALSPLRAPRGAGFFFLSLNLSRPPARIPG